MKREHLDRYPHEFSGGQKQRIVIARALACNPEVMILDEPTSSLDVSVQAQILNLLRELQQKFDLSYLFITHDLTVVQHIADRIEVMYLGKFVEGGKIEEVFYNPTHPYSRALLSARPTFDPTSKRNRIILEGDVPSPVNPPSGCAFHPRCFEACDDNACGIENPVRVELGKDHYMYCRPFLKTEKSYEGMEYISD
jgi:oligopeptide/dipeptide ABC transporter ATP-binding protein